MVCPSRTWVSCGLCVLLMLLVSLLPPVAGDGMPAYRLVDVDDPDHPHLFSSTFESRQLARVELVNDTHERISLFLSVYSLDPGKNMSIMVPLRTLPVDVTGEPMKESEFRERYLLDKATTEVVEQDPGKAYEKLWDETSSALQMTFGSMVLTLPGEYFGQKYRLVQDSRGKFEDAGGEGGAVVAEPEPVQHYEFDGFSIDVFGVDAAGILEDYLTTNGMVLPEGDALDRYMGQYVAVIEAESKPPIDPIDFDQLATWAPNTTISLRELLETTPTLDEDEISTLKSSLERDMWDELGDVGDSNLRYNLEIILHDLVDAVYGSTDFEGEVLTVDLPLDEGRMFFPLGTSAGWPNEVGDIDILFGVPDDRDLDLPGTKDAYFDGRHWYLLSMELANPDFDMESAVLEGDEARRAEAARADWTYENSEALGYLISVAIALVLWFGFAFFLRRGLELEGRLVRDPLLWAMLGLSVLISVPGALLVLLAIRPLPLGELPKSLRTMVPFAMYPAALVMLVLVVVL